MALLLRPSMLDDLGLIAALHWQVRELMRRTSLDITLVADDAADDLPEKHKTCVYRVVQEALNNCAKHSRAMQVRVLVRRDDGELTVTVQDDGVGFDPGRERGLGLLGIAERIERVDGLLSIRSASGHGTVLSARLPVPLVHAAVV
jgi:signal transduction histidine kinase